MAESPQTSANELPLNAALFTVFLCMLFGGNPTAMKICFSGVGVFTTAGIRFSTACIALFFLAKWTRKPLALSKTQFMQVTLISVIFFLQMAGFYFGQNKTTASHGALLANALPFMVMILAHFLLPDDKISCKKVVGLVFGFGGMMLLFFDQTHLSSDALLGDLTILAGVLLWGCNVVYIKKIIAGFNSIQITIFPMLLSLPLFFLAGLFWDEQMVHFLSTEIILALLYQGLVTASFGFIMWNTLVRKYGATALHSFVFLMPIFGVTFGVILLGESITPKLIGSICLVTTGLLIVNYRPRKISPSM